MNIYILRLVIFSLVFPLTLSVANAQIIDDTIPTSIETYDIAHLVDSEFQQELLSSSLSETLDTNIFDTWTEFLIFATLDMPDILIIDSSMIDHVDQATIVDMYNSGIPISFINVPTDTIRNMLNDETLNSYLALFPSEYEGNYSITVTFAIVGENEAEVARVRNHNQINEPLQGIEGVLHVFRSRDAFPLNTEEDLEGFSVRLLVTLLNLEEMYDQYEQAFANND